MDRIIRQFEPSYFAVLAGLQLMFACFVLFGAATPSPSHLRTLTTLGSGLYRPERELPIYAVSIGVTVVLSLILTARRRRAAPDDDLPAAASLRCLAGAIGAAAFLCVCLVMPPDPTDTGRLVPSHVWTLLGAAALIWTAVIAVSRYASRLARAEPRQAGPEPGPVDRGRRQRNPLGMADLILPALIFALVFIPDVEQVIGADFAAQRLHHWDFFVMGPAIGYLRGGALGSDVYTQYGVAFPVAAALLAKWIPLSYAGLLQIAITAGCIYYIGLYLLLRGALGSWQWAAAAAFAAINLQLFHGVDRTHVLWQFPSSTILRSPCDVWFFGALLLDTRSRTHISLTCASLLVGFALLFETDTGVYLAAALALYVVLTRWKIGSRYWTAAVGAVPAAILPAGIVLFLGLEVASRGRVLEAGFWSGWLEVFRVYPGGTGMLPITMSAEGMTLAYLVIGLYLVVLCFQINRWRAGLVTSYGAFAAGIALYGLAYLCQFIGRSHPFNLYHSCIPAVILAAIGMKKAFDEWHTLPSASRQITWAPAQALPVLIGGCVLVHMACLPEFQHYPNLLHPADERFEIGPTLGATAIPVAATDRELARDFGRVTAEARRLGLKRKSVLFLVNNDPAYYLASGTASRFRYSPLFQCLLTRELQAEFERQFVHERIDVVFIPAAGQMGPDSEPGADVRSSLRKLVHERYTLARHSGTFEVWELGRSGDQRVPRLMHRRTRRHAGKRRS